MIRLDDRTIRSIVKTPEDGWRVLAAMLWGPEGQRPDWHTQAACRGASHVPWFGRAATTLSKTLNEQFCHACPVRQVCLQETLQFERVIAYGGGSGSMTGHAGGLSAPDRRRLIAQSRERVGDTTSDDANAA